MNCIEATTKMKEYLEDELSAKETLRFIEHLKNCPDCRDEAEVQLLVSATLEVPSDGDLKSYDLRNLLEKKMRRQEQWISRMRLLVLLVVLITVGALSVLAVLLIYG